MAAGPKKHIVKVSAQSPGSEYFKVSIPKEISGEIGMTAEDYVEVWLEGSGRRKEIIIRRLVRSG